jgi:immune inhibitor A
MKRLSNFTLIVLSLIALSFFLLSTPAVMAISKPGTAVGSELKDRCTLHVASSELATNPTRTPDPTRNLQSATRNPEDLQPSTCNMAQTAASHMPPSEISIMSSLKSRSVIPKGATEDEAQRIYKRYLGLKLGKRPEDRPNPLAARQIAQGEKSGKFESHHGIIKLLPGMPVKGSQLPGIPVKGGQKGLTGNGGTGGGNGVTSSGLLVSQSQTSDAPCILGAGADDRAGLSTLGATDSASEVKLDNILILLVEFAGTDNSEDGSFTGPLHNAIPEPDRKCNMVDYWTPDFSREHYEQMLFDRTPEARSMSNYYLEQSGGVYTVSGNAYGWFKVNHAEWYYGADSAEGGTDNLNGPEWRLVEDAVEAAGDSVPWADYDKEDPYDIDGDDVYDEPDGYVDHIMIVHAGLGQEAGGGQEADSSIWSHSWWVNQGTGGPGEMGGVATSNSNVWVGAYTMVPEDGTLGVFCHEFGHDLGLPDEYDIAYSGEASTGLWSLMGSGGWLSTPDEQYLGTCPANLSIWCKYVLGWVDPVVVNPGPGKGSKKCVSLRPAEVSGSTNKAIKVNLPDYNYIVYVNEPHSADHEWYSDKGNNLDYTLTRLFALPPSGSEDSDGTSSSIVTLKFWTWYDIEQDWDYGCVEVSDDSGASWQTIPGNITTTTNPNGQNPGEGITGQSGDWVQAAFDLSSYSGENVLVRFRYWTDGATQGLGWTIDDIEVVVEPGESVEPGGAVETGESVDAGDSGESGCVIYSDDVENGPGDWEADGWRIFGGMDNLTASHYYLAEWRQLMGFDVGMKGWYNTTSSVPPYKLIERYTADPGMLLWYRDGQFDSGDNMVGTHPWRGFLLPVDSHPNLIEAADTLPLANRLYGFLPHFPDGSPHPLNQNLPFRTRVQTADATFGCKSTIASPLTSWWEVPTPGSGIPRLSPVSVFDDSITYADTSWSPWFLCWVYDQANGWQDYGQLIRNSINSVDTPSYGLKIEVIKEESNKTATVMVDFSGFQR